MYQIAIVGDNGVLEIIESDFSTEKEAWARIEELPTDTLDKSVGIDERYSVFEQ